MLRSLLGLILLISSFSAWSNSLEGLRLSQSDTDTRLVFDFKDEVKYKTFTLENPSRLVIDLEDTKRPRKLLIPELANTPIHAIRHAPWQKGSLRVVVDLKRAQQYKSQTLKPDHGYPYRLVIDLYPKGSPPSDVSQKMDKPSTTKPVAKVAPKVVPKTEQAISKPARPNLIITKSVKTMKKRDIIIAIDPGHGGQDSGALGKYKTKEKDVVLAIAKRLAKLIDKEPGMRSYLTRDHDVFIPLRHRIKRARDNHADMFISIHADAFKNTRAKGASVFVLSERGASSEAAQLLADKENAADLAGGISLEDKDDLLASVLLDMSQDASLEGSLEVANTVLSGLKRVGNVHKKHVESAAFVVLKSPDIPSLLVETAFISNPDEERKLKSPSHQNKLARAMMSGIQSYFQRNPLPNSALPQQHIVSQGDTLSTIAQRYRVSIALLKSNNKLPSTKLRVGQILLIP
ncbi:N-acetylmuramoyl-L-alanine amidase [Pseudomonadota bacterium]|nr:N-acetylmuramoyl-L-alanine amidase [Pseudomonadota bacterium]